MARAVERDLAVRQFDDVRRRAQAVRTGRLRRGRVQEFLLRGNAAEPGTLDAATVREIVAAPRPSSLASLRTTIMAGRSSFGLMVEPARFGRVLDAIVPGVLVIHGDRDRTVPVAQARALAGREGWTIEIFGGVGHLPHLEAPARWVQTVSDWLQRRPR
jgi:pimeloyl-ACP methyl ester carboxylesterase